MKTGTIAFLVALAATIAVQSEARISAAPAEPPMDQTQVKAVLNQYCVGCHNQRTKAGSLVLESADLSHIGENGIQWEKVVRKLRARLMPPAGLPRPADVTYAKFTEWFERELDEFAATHPNPGRTDTFRRLNRTEYQNAIRDLLALDIDVSPFVPADDGAFGFDHIGGVTKLSPALMESYLTAAKRISQMAMGTPPSVTDAGKVYPVSRLFQQHDRVDGMGFGTRGGTVVRHVFPQNAEYTIAVDMAVSISLLREPYTMVLLIDGTRVNEFNVVRVSTPRENLLSDAPEVIFTTRVPLTAGPHEIGVTFQRTPPSIPETVFEPRQLPSLSQYGFGDPGIGGPIPTVQSVTIGGPFSPAGPGDTRSRRRILVCRPTSAANETACAAKIVSTLARRAFRRPVTDDDMRLLLGFYQESRKGGDDFEGAIEKTVRRIIASPKFLFHVAATAPVTGAAPALYRVSDIELASRLSFFLWSSIPDDRLLDLAVRGRLKQPAVLAGEVQRMLADPRSESLTTSFAAQWLQLRKLESSRPGADYGKNFDGSLKEGLRRETELFFDSIVREDRPVTELLSANYTFLNERVARHYGIRGVQGSHFRRVALPADNPRRGLLGQGSILTLTSQGIRTSPVTRGKYILETIMGTPPPDPPPDVPALTEPKAGTPPKTMRERMAAHRANPVCSACHSMIDPLGFALENFDPVGAWREFDESLTVIDPSGAMPDGRKFGGSPELRSLLIQHPEQLASTITERLLTYALARGLEYYDMPVVRKIVRDAARQEYRFHAIVAGIVASDPFQMALRR